MGDLIVIGAILGSLLVALILTLIVELPIAALFGLRNKKALLSVFLINLITNPLANVLAALMTISFYIFGFIFIEIIVILTEWRLLVYSNLGSKTKMFWLSVVMNVVSAIVGVVIFFVVLVLSQGWL